MGEYCLPPFKKYGVYNAKMHNSRGHNHIEVFRSLLQEVSYSRRSKAPSAHNVPPFGYKNTGSNSLVQFCSHYSLVFISNHYLRAKEMEEVKIVMHIR